MALKGKNAETGAEVLVCDDRETAKEWHRAGVLVCPLCDAPVVPVREYGRANGGWVQAYLRHKSICTTTYQAHPESREHFAAKEWIRRNAPARYGYDVVSADLEVRMPEINRVADVCFTLADGERVIHEAQLAAISVDDLEARTNDYHSLGYAVVWHFGKSAYTEGNCRWAYHKLHNCEVLTFDVAAEAA